MSRLVLSQHVKHLQRRCDFLRERMANYSDSDSYQKSKTFDKAEVKALERVFEWLERFRDYERRVMEIIGDTHEASTQRQKAQMLMEGTESAIKRAVEAAVASERLRCAESTCEHCKNFGPPVAVVVGNDRRIKSYVHCRPGAPFDMDMECETSVWKSESARKKLRKVVLSG